MNNTLSGSAGDRISSPSTAFILYRAKTKEKNEEVSYNAEAWHILSMNSSVHLPSLYAEWKELLLRGRQSRACTFGDGVETELDYVALFQSQKRWYGVRGAFFLDCSGISPKPPKQENHFLFSLERIISDQTNLSMVSRLWNLSPREEDIVRLLLSDRSNKEIANSLGLSINTVKGYLKLLMRKVGVCSRTGVISRILTGRNTSSRTTP